MSVKNPYQVLCDLALQISEEESAQFDKQAGQPLSPDKWEPRFREREAELKSLVAAGLIAADSTGFPPLEVERRIKALVESVLALLLWQRDAPRLPAEQIQREEAMYGCMTWQPITGPYLIQQKQRVIEAWEPIHALAVRCENNSLSRAKPGDEIHGYPANLVEWCEQTEQGLRLLDFVPPNRPEDWQRPIDRLWEEVWNRVSTEQRPPDKPIVTDRSAALAAVAEMRQWLQAREVPSSIRDIPDAVFRQRATDAWNAASELRDVMKKWLEWFTQLKRTGDAHAGLPILLAESADACVTALYALRAAVPTLQRLPMEAVLRHFPRPPFRDRGGEFAGRIIPPWQQDEGWLQDTEACLEWPGMRKATDGQDDWPGWNRFMAELLGFRQLLERAPSTAIPSSDAIQGSPASNGRPDPLAHSTNFTRPDWTPGRHVDRLLPEDAPLFLQLENAFTELLTCMRDRPESGLESAPIFHARLSQALGLVGKALSQIELAEIVDDWSAFAAKTRARSFARNLLQLSRDPTPERIASLLRQDASAPNFVDCMRRSIASYAEWLLGALRPAEDGKQEKRPAKTGKPGRPRDTDPKKDKCIYDAWNTGEHANYEELATTLGGGATKKTVKHAIDRHRQRLKRGTASDK